VVIRFAIGLAILAAAFGVLEALWPARRQPRVRRGFATDLAYWAFTPLVAHRLAAIAVIAVALVALAVAGVHLDRTSIAAFMHRPTWFHELPRAAQIALVLIVGDLFGYWLHRGFHRGRLWRFHAIHHSSVDLDWLSATRLHPVNDALQRVLQTIPMFALGFDGTVLIAYAPILTLLAIVQHANVTWGFGPLRYVIASPTFHRWHHTGESEGLDKNFAGFLPLWDLVFGTFYMPAGRQPTAFGVRDHVPDGLLGQLAWPFKR
jgi:sterol desaturase/sphingolipid hydroxylase (fatty acid hydroxylase superfamily)